MWLAPSGKEGEMVEEVEADARRRMHQTVEMAGKDLVSVRTGRASANLLDPVRVDYFGTPTPLNQLATLNTPDPQLITITPFDKSTVKGIEKAILASGLGFNPSSDGTLIRVPIPVLTEERRKEMVKHVKKLGEERKIAIRNIRRDSNDHLKKMEKNKEISQDQEKDAHDNIQVETDKNIKAIDDLVNSKEKELLTV